MKAEIDRFLQCGDSDSLADSWPGRSALERMTHCREVLTTVLLEEVRFRAGRVDTPVPEAIVDGDLVTFARNKFARWCGVCSPESNTSRCSPSWSNR